MSRKGYPVTIRGKTYPSQSAAARAHNVPTSAIYFALERGTLDNVGLGRNHSRQRRISVDGKEYNRIVDVSADHPDMSPSSISSVLCTMKARGKTEAKYKGRIIKPLD